MQIAGKDGGMCGSPTTLEEVRHRHAQDDRPPSNPLEYRKQAEYDLKRAKRNILSFKRRKACVQWSVPAELLICTLRPSYFSGQAYNKQMMCLAPQPATSKFSHVSSVVQSYVAQHGSQQQLSDTLFAGQLPMVGNAGMGLLLDYDTEHVDAALLNVHMATCTAGRPPVEAILSQGWELDKRNGKRGTKGTRLIHGSCAYWRNTFRAVWRSSRKQQAKHSSIPPDACGGRPFTRREGAIMVQLVASLRLKSFGLSFIDQDVDVANAFGSVHVEKLEQHTCNMLHVNDRPLFAFKSTNLVVHLDTPFDELYMGLEQECTHGDGNATDEFWKLFIHV